MQSDGLPLAGEVWRYERSQLCIHWCPCDCVMVRLVPFFFGTAYGLFFSIWFGKKFVREWGVCWVLRDKFPAKSLL
jgi:hypothetical protein